VWVGISLLFSSAIFAYIASWLLGGGIEVFGILLGVEILQMLICFVGGMVFCSGLSGGGK